jgi:hypothetical protein
MSSVVPQTRSLGNRALYETLFGTVFFAGERVSRADIHTYCCSTRYGSGEHLDAALELLVNLGALRPDGDHFSPDRDFLLSAKETSVPLALSLRLLDALAANREIETVFPSGTLSWGKSDGDLNIHLSQVPMQKIVVVKLLRDLGIVRDSEDGAAIVTVRSPLAQRLRDAVCTASARTRAVRVLSPDQLERLQQAQSKQGADAEEFVLALEKKRLQGHAQLQLVRRISLTNTAAGYDIESFEGLRSFLPDRFIEVKSHQEVERFFLSSGEMEAAKELGERYYLYVIDMRRFGEAGYHPLIIRNPALVLLNQDSGWSVSTSVFAVARSTLTDS